LLHHRTLSNTQAQKHTPVGNLLNITKIMFWKPLCFRLQVKKHLTWWAP